MDLKKIILFIKNKITYVIVNSTFLFKISLTSKNLVKFVWSNSKNSYGTASFFTTIFLLINKLWAYIIFKNI